MSKRKSDTGRARSVKKSTSEAETLSNESITKATNDIISSIDSIDVKSLTSVIALYDSLLPKFDTEEGLEKFEGVARLLNVQLTKIFEELFAHKKLSPSKDDGMTFKKLKQSYELFKFNLLFFLENISLDCSLIMDNLDIYMKLLRLESTHFAPVSKDGSINSYFPTKSYKDLITSLLKSQNGEILGDGTSSSIVLQEFLTSYYSKYYDLQFYFFAEIDTENFKDADTEAVFSKFLTIAKEKQIVLSITEDSKSFLNNLPSIVTNQNHYKTEFENKWLYFLNQGLSTDQYKTVLLVLHKRIIPAFKKPTNLMDFLTDSYEVGGSISILALNGLFELIKKYNLDYPNFYQKLYSLFDAKLLHTRYRSRFFRLTDLFLSSTHLPAALVASFIKKMARLSLSAPPSAVVSIIPFIYNLLKRHPTCMILLQNADASDDYNDPYDDSITDPYTTNAIESSLWEMETMASHYHPNVATLAKIYSQPFRKLNYNMEDFLDWSYDSLLESENTRKLKTEVALEFDSFESVIGDYIQGWEW